jgi:hypothetical protein
MQIHYIQTALYKRVVLSWERASGRCHQKRHAEFWPTKTSPMLPNRPSRPPSGTGGKTWTPQATNFAWWKPSPLCGTHQPSPSGIKLCWPNSGSAIPSTLLSDVGYLMEGGPPSLYCGFPLCVPHFLIHCKHLQTIISEHLRHPG